MSRFPTCAAAAAFAAIALAVCGQPALAQGTARGTGLDVSAQSADPAIRSRPRTRIRVTPAYPRRTQITFYPLPDGVDYPGPNAVRHCSFRLAQEYRPSGAVIVPRERCWWAHR